MLENQRAKLEIFGIAPRFGLILDLSQVSRVLHVGPGLTISLFVQSQPKPKFVVIFWFGLVFNWPNNKKPIMNFAGSGWVWVWFVYIYF